MMSVSQLRLMRVCLADSPSKSGAYAGVSRTTKTEQGAWRTTREAFVPIR